MLLSVSKLNAFSPTQGEITTVIFGEAALGKEWGWTLFLITLKLGLDVFCLFAELSERWKINRKRGEKDIF